MWRGVRSRLCHPATIKGEAAGNRGEQALQAICGTADSAHLEIKHMHTLGRASLCALYPVLCIAKQLFSHRVLCRDSQWCCRPAANRCCK